MADYTSSVYPIQQALCGSRLAVGTGREITCSWAVRYRMNVIVPDKLQSEVFHESQRQHKG